MTIDTGTVGSDGWWLEQCWLQLRNQRRECENLHKRYRGDPPLPGMNPRQRSAVRWFMGKSRTNFERLIVNAVLSRTKVRGIRTAVDNDEGGDADAYRTWKESGGKLWSRDVHKHALTMRQGYIVVGKHPITGRLCVTAEDPRDCTAITDPADKMAVRAGMKMVFDPWQAQDIAYLYLPGRVAVARRTRGTPAGNVVSAFGGPILPMEAYGPHNMQSFVWDESSSGDVPWLVASGDLEAVAPIVPFVNEDAMAEFEPHLELLDRINHQILQRMTIATIQAFRQRAMKGLPQTYPRNHPMAGQKIDYEEIFTADPGAIWNIPQAAEIWESGQADFTSLIAAIRDDIKDMAAVSDSPLYYISPDIAAQGSAEGAVLQREGITFKVESRQELWELPHERVCELIFRTIDKPNLAERGKTEIIWGNAERLSWTEIGSSMAQTKLIIPTYMQLTKIAGFTPDEADRAMKMLDDDIQRQIAQAQAANAQLRDAHAGGAEEVGQKIPPEPGRPMLPGQGVPATSVKPAAPPSGPPAPPAPPGRPNPPRPPTRTRKAA